MAKTQTTNTRTVAAGTISGGAEVIQGAANKGAESTTTTAPAGGNSETVVAATAVPKTHKANAVFARMFAEPVEKRPARKDMIAAAMKEAGISKDCAATYLQNFKRRNGLDKTGQAKLAAAPAA